eukprot:TRINITY_DN66406_c5_g1_i1.p1 TRINITY_DN66406_c5_g1~~TRINITY_DN66406_c5_g1_i1.p1  ORF type:complete len:183 (-),score=104.72 TRINITY_DN66406_c5_g1_i1:128-676(-)
MSSSAVDADGGALQSLLPLLKSCKVSSVLNSNGAEYGKKFMLDGDHQTCWNSEQGKPQHVALKFSEPVDVVQVQVMFQGGFVGLPCVFYSDVAGDDDDEEKQQQQQEQKSKKKNKKKNKDELYRVTTWEPEDGNSMQTFTMPKAAFHRCRGVKKLRLVFEDSTDFFGRVTVYKLDVLGRVHA